MQNTIYHWIPVSVLAEITKQSPRKLKKLYRIIIEKTKMLCQLPTCLASVFPILMGKVGHEDKPENRGN